MPAAGVRGAAGGRFSALAAALRFARPLPWWSATRLLPLPAPPPSIDAERAALLSRRYQHEGVREFEWRRGDKLRPYIFDAIALVDSLPDSAFPRGKPAGLEFVHFPIVDCSIASEASVLQLAFDLVARLARGETMYIHCWCVVVQRCGRWLLSA